MKFSTVLALTAVLAFGGVVMADVNLNDMNSDVWIDTDSDSGMYTWSVDGTDHMYQQWFWFRTSSDTQENPISDLFKLSETTADTNTIFDPDDDQLTVVYGDGATLALSSFAIQIKFGLGGGSAGTGLSDITEQISIFNFDSSSLEISFFQYSDFDLGATISDDTVRMVNANTVRQTDGSGVTLNETVVTPAPTHLELGEYNDTLVKLNDGNVDDLNDNSGPIGPLDVTWAFQWDFTIAGNGSVLISKDKSLQIPAPGAALLAVMGMGMVGWVRRRFS